MNDPDYDEWSNELSFQAQLEMDTLINLDEYMLEQLNREEEDEL